VENQAKTLHAVAYLKPSLFSTYEFFGDQDTRESEALLHPSKSQAALADRLADTCFRINLASLLDCLTVFGSLLHATFETFSCLVLCRHVGVFSLWFGLTRPTAEPCGVACSIQERPSSMPRLCTSPTCGTHERCACCWKRGAS